MFGGGWQIVFLFSQGCQPYIGAWGLGSLAFEGFDDLAGFGDALFGAGTDNAFKGFVRVGSDFGRFLPVRQGGFWLVQPFVCLSQQGIPVGLLLGVAG